jgi:hypothetical protein
MWWDVAIDVLWPSRAKGRTERSLDRIVDWLDPGTLPVRFGIPGELKRRVNESGWLADEVIAAGVLRQGKAPSLLALVTGLALIQMARPRRSKSLPREFALAVTADRVVAFAMSPSKEAEQNDLGFTVNIKPGECGSWPRHSVRLSDPQQRVGWKDATIELAGPERIPVAWDGDDSTDELVELLSR